MGRLLGGSRQVRDQSDKSLWIIDHYAVPPTLTGFTRQYEHGYLLKDHGWETTIFASSFDHKRRRFHRPAKLRHPKLEAKENGVEFVWLYSTPYQTNNWRRYVNMISFLMVSVLAGVGRSRPDAILASSPHLFSALAGWVLARRFRVPFVLEIRDLWPESLVQLGMTNGLVIKTLEVIERFLYSKADLIFPLTEGIEDGIRRKGFDHKEMIMIPNASLRPRPLNPSRRKMMRHSLGWEDKTVSIWIGAHGLANGLDVIIDAARLLENRKDLLFVLVGSGPDKARLIEHARGMRNVEFHESVPKQEVADYLRAADIALLVHRDTDAVKGARPNKLFDYMAASLPIVINMDGEARRLSEEAGVGVFVPAEQPGELAKAVADLHCNPSRRIELGQSGYRHVAHAHSREDNVETIHRVLDDLIIEWESRNVR